jgi:carbon-monoxide dehydrogenase medium subunit
MNEEEAMPQSFEYYRPATRAEALALLASPDFNAAPLIVQPKPAAPRQMGIDAFVDLSRLGLDYIQETLDGATHIGSLATLQEMVESPMLMDGARMLLSRAAELTAGPGIRNLAGLWGAIQSRSGPPEILLSLLVLEAEVVLLGMDEKQRSLAFPEFLGMGERSLQKGELVLEALLPPRKANSGWALDRVSRTPRDEAIVAAAAVVEVKDGKASRVILALGGSNPLPGRSLPVEEWLRDKTFTPQILLDAAAMVEQQAEPVGDFRGSPEYRRCMAGLVASRALETAWKQANGIKK